MIGFNDFVSETGGFVEDEKINKKQVKEVIESFVSALTYQICEKESVNIPGLGIFKYKENKARKGRNPITGKSIDIPAKAAIVFKPSKSFKERLSMINV